MFHKPLLTGALVLACAASAPAAVIFSDNFDGAVGTNLHGLTTDVGGKTWSADALFKADGSYTTGTNTDRSAALDLGATFFADQFSSGNNKVILTVTFNAAGNSTSLAYAGFSTDAWVAAATSGTASDFSAGARGHTQGLTLNLERDTISPNSSNLHRDTTATDGGTAGEVRDVLSATVSSSYILTIEAGASGYANSIITLTDGTNTTSITGYDATGLRTFYLGVEVGSSGSANYDFVQLEAVPEPSIALLGGLGLLGLLRRRRA